MIKDTDNEDSWVDDAYITDVKENEDADGNIHALRWSGRIELEQNPLMGWPSMNRGDTL